VLFPSLAPLPSMNVKSRVNGPLGFPINDDVSNVTTSANAIIDVKSTSMKTFIRFPGEA
jgi:hypothetical protein